MYLFDTNMCIFIIKQKYKNVMDKLKKNRKKGFYLSSITLAELEFGIENADPAFNTKNRMALMNFLVLFEVKYFDENAAKEFGKIKKELKDKKCLIGPLDMLIGAHAKSLNMILVTSNIEEFKRIDGLKIEDWIK